MARPTRTLTAIKDEIILVAAKYASARTDWESERRGMKKAALRKMTRLVRQICKAGQHRIGWVVDGRKPEAFDCCHIGEGLKFKCPVCDPSGEHKRESNLGVEGYKLRKAKLSVIDLFGGKEKGLDPASKLGECVKCHSTMEKSKLSLNGICFMCES